MGVWIETAMQSIPPLSVSVTPCMGVWIETSGFAVALKRTQVTPCMGVWIETIYPGEPPAGRSHTLYGCVD